MLQNIHASVVRFLKEEDGPTAVEYAVVLAGILLVCIASFAFMSSTTNESFQDSGEAIAGATN